jgi:hypothetical protein
MLLVYLLIYNTMQSFVYLLLYGRSSLIPVPILLIHRQVQARTEVI